MAHLFSGKSSKPHSPQKAFLMGELATTKRSLEQKDEEMRQLEERLQRLETAHVRQPRGGSIGELQGASLNMATMRKMKIGE